VLLTGDNEAAARAVAAEVGIDEVIAEVLPSEKVDAVRRLQAEGRVVAMVGDGVNDAAALAAADLGLAMGTGTDVAIEASDLTLVRGDLRAVGDALRLARRTLATIKGNLFWAFAYNLAALPLAALGLLNPLIAVRRWRSAASSWSPTACGCAASTARRGEGDWAHETAPQQTSGTRRSGLIAVALMVALMWVLEVVDTVLDGRLDQGGIEPREVDSLTGVVTAPFLHAGFGHLISNTVPFLVLGALIAFSGLVRVLKVTAIVVLVGGLGTWLVAPAATLHLGASILVFGYATYLIARGLFDRRLPYLLVGWRWRSSTAARCSSGWCRGRASRGRAPVWCVGWVGGGAGAGDAAPGVSCPERLAPAGRGSPRRPPRALPRRRPAARSVPSRR
jgi:hypothetical protein